MPWTRFMDMHSGGGSKEPYNYIYIEAPEEKAKVIFYNRFGHSPERVSCTCCGEDYSIYEYETLEEASKYDREHSFAARNKPIKFEDWLLKAGEQGHHESFLLVYTEDIRDDEKEGNLPRQGYVWI